MTPDAVIAQARDWVGVRFLHQGRGRTGADCIGFLAGMLAELGLSQAIDAMPHNYARAPQARLLKGVWELCTACELKPAALLLIKLPLTDHPSHAAIFTGVSMIHSDGMHGKVVEHAYAGLWVKRTHSIWELPGVMY